MPKTSYSDQGEDVVLDRVLWHVAKHKWDKPGFYLDIGAHHPTKGSVTKRLYDRGWRGVCVDMDQNSIDLFAEQRPEDIAVRAAAAETDGELTGYYVASGTSLFHTCDPVEAERLRGKYEVREERVPALSATSIMDLHAPGKSVDFLNIDVQRLEMDVLQGIDFTRYAPKVLAVEIHTDSIDKMLTSEVSGYLRYQGYKPVASCVITSFWYRKPQP